MLSRAVLNTPPSTSFNLPRSPLLLQQNNMEHIQKGPCCVCGVTTTQRCSSCANHGLNLFLCGREHQKLVRFSPPPSLSETTLTPLLQIWYAHKKVCGVNSNPFRFPPLTPEEISTATARRSEDPLHSASLSGTLCGRYEWMKDSDLPVRPMLSFSSNSPRLSPFLAGSPQVSWTRRQTSYLSGRRRLGTPRNDKLAPLHACSRRPR